MDSRWIWDAQLGCMVRYCVHVVKVRTWGVLEYCRERSAAQSAFCTLHSPRLSDLELDYAAERGLLPDGEG